MTGEMKRVIWEWLPGVVAGLIPLVVFVLVKATAYPFDDPHLAEEARKAATAAAEKSMYAGFVEHLIVFSIVTSTVSTFTSFPRLFANNQAGAPIGQASLGLVMLITLLLVLSVAMYVLHVAGVTDSYTVWPGVLLMLATLMTSFYMEVTIANVRLAKRERTPSAT